MGNERLIRKVRLDFINRAQGVDIRTSVSCGAVFRSALFIPAAAGPSRKDIRDIDHNKKQGVTRAEGIFTAL